MMEHYAGIEPTSSPWGGRCSTVELIARLERAAGIEPPLAAWKVAVLPLYYARTAPRRLSTAPFGGWRSAWAPRRGWS